MIDNINAAFACLLVKPLWHFRTTCVQENAAILLLNTDLDLRALVVPEVID